MKLLERIDALVDGRHLLDHPFYTKWADGTLPREALQEYARQYYAFESSFPRFLSALHSRTDSPAVRQQLLDNLWDEEHGADNHAELWLRFAEGIGISRDDVRGATHNEATQALVNPYYGIDGVKLLREGRSPGEVVGTLIATDDGREARQLHVMDKLGRIAAHTGRECIDWCGHIQGDGFSLAGNMLAGAAVLDDTAKAYAANSALPFAQRLIAAMKAGEAAGGDKRGRQSAALLVYSGEQYANLNLRVDDHVDPLAELRRLYDKAHERFIPYLMCSPSKARPWGLLDRALIEQEIAAYRRPAS